MKTEEIARELQHYLALYAVDEDPEHLPGIITYAGMLAGRVTK